MKYFCVDGACRQMKPIGTHGTIPIETSRFGRDCCQHCEDKNDCTTPCTEFDKINCKWKITGETFKEAFRRWLQDEI